MMQTIENLIWSWCSFCCIITNQALKRKEGRFAVYICDACGNEHKIAVR